MASQTTSPTPAPTAQVVASAFVEQYYLILHQSPELVHKFYLDWSMLSRPEANGVMTSVTTMQAINDKILSLNYKDFKVEIKTVDAQDSYKGGVIVLVTGFLTGSDNVGKTFIQSFFLAPQDKGYFVLNDVFRYTDENELPEINTLSVHDTVVDAPGAPLNPDQESAPVLDDHLPEPTTSHSEEYNKGGVVGNHSEESSILEEEPLPPAPSNQNVGTVVEISAVVKEDTPKKSYASIVKVKKENKASSSVTTVATTSKVVPTNIERQPVSLAAPASESPAPSNNNGPESSSHHQEAETSSIYVRNLPFNITDAQLESEFKKFGPIKPGGVQVRSNKGSCFGFVEFESLSYVRNAIEASPIVISGRQAFVEEKRATSQGGSGGGRGRFPSGMSRGGFRSDSFRGRTNFGGRGAYSQTGYGNRGGDYGNRGHSSSGRVGYQRVDQNGNRRVAGGPPSTWEVKQTTSSS